MKDEVPPLSEETKAEIEIKVRNFAAGTIFSLGLFGLLLLGLMMWSISLIKSKPASGQGLTPPEVHLLRD